MCNCNCNPCNRGLFGGIDESTLLIIIIVLFFVCGWGNCGGYGYGGCGCGGCGCGNMQSTNYGCDNNCGC